MNILIGDQETRVRHGLQIFLEQQPGWKILGEAADAGMLLRLARECCPDLILINWELPGLSAQALLPALRQACPKVCLIALSGGYEPRQAALDAGAHAFASKTDPPERLLALIRACVPERSNLGCFS